MITGPEHNVPFSRGQYLSQQQWMQLLQGGRQTQMASECGHQLGPDALKLVPTGESVRRSMKSLSHQQFREETALPMSLNLKGTGNEKGKQTEIPMIEYSTQIISD